MDLKRGICWRDLVAYLLRESKEVLVEKHSIAPDESILHVRKELDWFGTYLIQLVTNLGPKSIYMNGKY